MGIILTYGLREAAARSDAFYRDLSAFTDEVVTAGGRLARPVRAFMAYLEQSGLEKPRTNAEYVYELLVLGVLWRVYGRRATRLTKIPQGLLAWLARLREQRPRLKPLVDFLRGKLSAVFLHPPQLDPQPFKGSLANLPRLLDWLDATGDFTQAVRRLRRWQDWLRQPDPLEAAATIEQALAYAAWFEEQSITALGKYTPNVERFLVEKHPAFRGREDDLFTGKQRVEYHLNMVGTEILNRALREAFLATRQKVVLLSPCMSAPAEKCQARETSFGALCAACTVGCRVHQITKLGEKYGFKVFQLPEELRVFKDLTPSPFPEKEGEKEVGVVGVSCALTNANGGWDVRGLGIPAQGLLLDYCGCSYHWHPEGIPTDINIQQLLRLLGIADPQ